MGGSLSVSREYSTIGETSIKSTKTNEASVDVIYSVSNNELNKQVTFVFDAYSPDNTNIFLSYRDINSTAHIITSTILPKEMSTKITLSAIIPPDADTVFIRVSNSVSLIYVTNVVINIQ